MRVSKIIHIISDFLSSVFCLIFPKSQKQIRLEAFQHSDWKEMMKPGEYEDVYYFFSYEKKDVRDAVWEIKYRRNKIIADKIIKAACETLLPDISENMLFGNFRDPIVTFIPQAKKRKNERGFNQSKDLAENIALNLGINAEEFLEKIKETESQTKLKRSKRLINMKNSFSVLKSKNVEGKNIILVDDVVTTGSTLNEARITLLKAGAKKVLCIALAH